MQVILQFCNSENSGFDKIEVSTKNVVQIKKHLAWLFRSRSPKFSEITISVAPSHKNHCFPVFSQKHSTILGSKRMLSM